MSAQDDLQLYLRTPLVPSHSLGKKARRDVLLKLENLQESGSFKMRGMAAAVQKAVKEGCTEIVTSSGGNAGLAVACSCARLGVKCIVIVPSTTPEATRKQIAGLGAEVTVHGDVWDEADQHARKLATSETTGYVHPFDDPVVWTGHSKMIDEIKEDMRGVKPALFVVSVGGGGLLCGLCEGLEREGWGDIPIIAVETEGAASLTKSVEQDKLITLPAITSIATSLGAKTVCAESFAWTKKRKVINTLVTDRETATACRQFADDHRMLVEPACGASLAAIYGNKLDIADPTLAARNGPIVVIVCGGAIVSIDRLEHYRKVTQ